MPLDMTGPHRHTPKVHYRRYLNRDNRVSVVCVQNFDYPDYDSSRFLDLQSFDTELEAEYTPIRSQDVLDQVNENPDDLVVLGQAERLLEAIRQHSGRRTALLLP